MYAAHTVSTTNPSIMFTYYLSLGTNLGNRTENIDCAIDLLTHRVGKPVSRSALYDTAPVGFASANRFLNAAVVLRSRLTPDEVLQATQLIEREMGRTHKSTDNGYTDRIIDIDILLAETPETPQTPHLVIDTPQFCLPHKHLAERRFVLEPLAEIAPEAWHPLLQCTVSQLLDVLNTAHIAPPPSRRRDRPHRCPNQCPVAPALGQSHPAPRRSPAPNCVAPQRKTLCAARRMRPTLRHGHACPRCPRHRYQSLGLKMSL